MKIRLGLGKLKMSLAAEYCHGDLYDFSEGTGTEISYICTDSREADKDTLFVAIRGERVDGHDYIGSALDAGCKCFLCEYVPDSFAGRRASAVVVEDSVTAFSQIATGYRENSPMHTVAVTGSVGKTTTKEMVSAVLSRKYNVYRTDGNYNSMIGMPMSLMEAGNDCDGAVFEMGMSGFGEIKAMSDAAKPTVAMITNIGTSHLEYLETRENICRAKMEITSGLVLGGTLILNGDEPLLSGKYSDKYRTVYVSLDNPESDIRAVNLIFDDESSQFDIVTGNNILKSVCVPATGRHIVYAALFAYAAAKAMDVSDEDIRAGLADYKPGVMRQNIIESGNITIISDCYNAAPESMRAALSVLSGMGLRRGKRTIAVLGDMRELGTDSDRFHREVGKYAAELNISMMFTVGESGAMIAGGAEAAGMPADRIHVNRDIENINETVEAIRGMLCDGDIVLVKASRGVRAERIVAALRSGE